MRKVAALRLGLPTISMSAWADPTSTASSDSESIDSAGSSAAAAAAATRPESAPPRPRRGLFGRGFGRGREVASRETRRGGGASGVEEIELELRREPEPGRELDAEAIPRELLTPDPGPSRRSLDASGSGWGQPPSGGQDLHVHGVSCSAPIKR